MGVHWPLVLGFGFRLYGPYFCDSEDSVIVGFRSLAILGPISLTDTIPTVESPMVSEALFSGVLRYSSLFE